MRTTAAVRSLPSTVVALLAALALAVATLLLTGVGGSGSDQAGATWNRVAPVKHGATWNAPVSYGATWN